MTKYLVFIGDSGFRKGLHRHEVLEADGLEDAARIAQNSCSLYDGNEGLRFEVFVHHGTQFTTITEFVKI